MKFFATIAFVLLSLTFSTTVLADPPFHALFLDGEVVRTVVPPASAPMTGKDNIYPVMYGVEDQLPVAAVGPGSEGYHGGKWAVHVVTWLETPYLLTSEQEVMDAYYYGDITITRVMEADFKCPIQKQPRN